MAERIIGVEAHNGKQYAAQMAINEQNTHYALMVDSEMINSTYTNEFTTAQTAANIIVPIAGTKVCVRGVSIITDATTGEIALDFATSGKKVARLYATAQNRANLLTGHLVGATDEPLKITTTTGTNKVFVLVKYMFHE